MLLRPWFPGSIAHRLSGIDGKAWPAAFAQAHGRAVLVDPMKPELKPTGAYL
jgi:hypothetical protein